MAKNRFDITLKDVFSGLEEEFCKLFLGLSIKKAIKQNIELNKIEEKKADYIAKIIDEDEKEYILHLEFQVSNHKNMNIRMLRYWSEIYQKYNLPIIQVVIFVGKDKLNMKNKIISNTPYSKIDFEYKIIDIRNLDCNLLLESNNPDLLILSILCDIKEDKSKFIHKLLLKLNDIINNDENQFKNYMLKLETLSDLRNLNEIVQKEEEMLEGYKVPVERLPSYQLAMKRGITSGIEQGMEQEKKFIVLNGYKEGIDIKVLSKLTALSPQEIKKIIEGK